MRNSIIRFYMDLLENRKYYLILKIKLSDGKWVSVHKAILISRETMDDYIEFVNWQLSFHADESKFRTIVFQFIEYNPFNNKNPLKIITPPLLLITINKLKIH